MTLRSGLIGVLLCSFFLFLGAETGASARAVVPPTGSGDTVDTKPLRLLMVGLAQDMSRINSRRSSRHWEKRFRGSCGTTRSFTRRPLSSCRRRRRATGRRSLTRRRRSRRDAWGATRRIGTASGPCWLGRGCRGRMENSSVRGGVAQAGHLPLSRPLNYTTAYQSAESILTRP